MCDAPDGNRPCRNSFAADTPVATADGPRPISRLRSGDRVWAFAAGTQTTALFTVTDVLVHTDPQQVWLTLDSAHLETTPEHPFFTTARGWVDAGDLRLGEHVQRRDGRVGVVRGLRVEREAQTMDHLTVALAHTFFVGEGGWLVHNAGGCENLIFRVKVRNLGERVVKHGLSDDQVAAQRVRPTTELLKHDPKEPIRGEPFWLGNEGAGPAQGVYVMDGHLA